jgi:hypothetical protein
LAGETEESGKDISCMFLLPPRMWLDVACTDPDGPGRDASCCVMARCVMARSLNHSHVLYVGTELLQLHYMCSVVKGPKGAL